MLLQKKVQSVRGEEKADGATGGHKADAGATLSSCQRRAFLSLGLRLGAVCLGGGLLSLLPAGPAAAETLGTGVLGSYPFKPHYAMLVYADRCTGCGACVRECHSLHDVPSYGLRLQILERQRAVGDGMAAELLHLPLLCNQCNRPPCVRTCPTRALYKDPASGIVLVDESMCIGCRACMSVCPYGALYYRQETRSVDKCDFCYRSRLNGGRQPACAEVCPAEVFYFGDLADEGSLVRNILRQQEGAVTVVRPERGTMPNVFYMKG